jgi:hypothetical protein
MKNAFLVNEMLTIVLNDGTLCTKSGMTSEDYFRIIEMSDEDIKKTMRPNLAKEEEKIIQKKRLFAKLTDLVSTNLFTLNNGVLYRIGINLSVPELLASEFVKAYENYINDDNFGIILEDYPEFKKLDNFWMWLSLNPNEESRNDLFRFLDKHQLAITPEGMILAYRRVYTVSEVNKAVISFVSNQWIKVKTIWKKKPSDYEVFKKDGEYFITSKSADKVDYDSHVGNLDSLYNNLEQFGESQFTDAHTRSFNYKIGVENRMERHQGNQSNQVSCSKGFHLASPAYSYSGFGDTPVLCVFNPKDALAVPNGEDGKLRVCAFTIVAVLEEEEDGKFLDQSLDLNDVLGQHYQEQIDELQKLVSSNTAYELKINNILSGVTEDTLENILDRANDVINNRTINV